MQRQRTLRACSTCQDDPFLSFSAPYPWWTRGGLQRACGGRKAQVKRRREFVRAWPAADQLPPNRELQQSTRACRPACVPDLPPLPSPPRPAYKFATSACPVQTNPPRFCIECPVQLCSQDQPYYGVPEPSLVRRRRIRDTMTKLTNLTQHQLLLRAYAISDKLPLAWSPERLAPMASARGQASHLTISMHGRPHPIML